MVTKKSDHKGGKLTVVKRFCSKRKEKEGKDPENAEVNPPMNQRPSRMKVLQF